MKFTNNNQKQFAIWAGFIYQDESTTMQEYAKSCFAKVDFPLNPVKDSKENLENFTPKQFLKFVDDAIENDKYVSIFIYAMRKNLTKLDFESESYVKDSDFKLTKAKSKMTTNRPYKIIVVGMWPKQRESLNFQFSKQFFEQFEVDYVPVDKVRLDKIRSAKHYDLVCVNSSTLNHCVSSALQAKCKDYYWYNGGVSALKNVIIKKITEGAFEKVSEDRIPEFVI